MTRSRFSRANLTTYSIYFLLLTFSSDLFLTTFRFFSPFPRSFRSFASYRIQYTRYVCRSISCIVPGCVASSLSIKNEKGSKAKFVAPIVFRLPEMRSLWMIDPRKEKTSPPIFNHRDLTFFVF